MIYKKIINHLSLFIFGLMMGAFLMAFILTDIGKFIALILLVGAALANALIIILD